MAKYRQRNKTTSVLKEDIWAIRLLAKKAISKEEVFQYPVATISLSWSCQSIEVTIKTMLLFTIKL